MADSVSVRVTGLDDLQRAFDQVQRELLAELGAGFVPKARYHGMGGVPFVVGRVRLVAQRAGFEVSGMDDGE